MKKLIRLSPIELQIKLKAAYDDGVTEGICREREASKIRTEIQRFELATKLINSIGQTQQQFADMLRTDGVIAKLLKQ